MSRGPIEHADVLIVGAGLSGVGAACQLRQECPDKSVVVLEARAAVGGTWDLFRYPGIRSDSDMFTLGYRIPAVDRAQGDRRRAEHPALHQRHRPGVRRAAAHSGESPSG